MPSRKLTSHCPSCNMKNHLRAPYCNQCGRKLEHDHMPTDADGRAKLYADIAHPINSACREMIQDSVIREYEAELERAKQPGYVSRYDDFEMDYSEPPRRSSAPAARENDRAPAAGESRVDVAHHHRGPHAPRDAGPAPAPQPQANPTPHPGRSQARNNPGFGAGIFPDDVA